MPYRYPNNVPNPAKNMPAGAQRLCIKAANAVLKEGGTEEEAIFACLHNVKTKYEKKGGKWVFKSFSKMFWSVTSIEKSTYSDGTAYERCELEQGENRISLNFIPSFITEMGQSVRITIELPDLEAKVATEQDKKARKSRNKRYGIPILEGGHVTKPTEYEACPESKFADSTNYFYPMNTVERARAALRYFGMSRNYGEYPIGARAKIWGRMKRLAKAFDITVDKTPPWKR